MHQWTVSLLVEENRVTCSFHSVSKDILGSKIPKLSIVLSVQPFGITLVTEIQIKLLFRNVLFEKCCPSMLWCEMSPSIHTNPQSVCSPARFFTIYLSLAVSFYLSIEVGVLAWIRFPYYWHFLSGICRWRVDSLQKGSAMRSFDGYFHLSPNKLLSKRPYGQ